MIQIIKAILLFEKKKTKLKYNLDRCERGETTAKINRTKYYFFYKEKLFLVKLHLSFRIKENLSLKCPKDITDNKLRGYY